MADEDRNAPSELQTPSFWEYAPGLKLAWTEFGDPSGFPVMFYHGWPSSRLQGTIAHSAAAELGLRLIAADRPGMGRSDTVKGRRLSDWPGLIGRFADFLGLDRFAQLGVSGGGPYVLACAALIPDRLAASSVLCGMVPLAFAKGGQKYLSPAFRAMVPFRKLPPACLTPGLALLGASAKLRLGRIPGFITSLVMPEKDRSVLVNQADRWQAINRSVREGIAGQGNAGVLSDANVFFEDPGFEPGDVIHPVRWWHGDDDHHIGLPLVRALFGKMPVGTLEVAAGYGHFSLALDYCPAALAHIAAEVS